jgi:hypothetical protein
MPYSGHPSYFIKELKKYPNRVQQQTPDKVLKISKGPKFTRQKKIIEIVKMGATSHSAHSSMKSTYTSILTHPLFLQVYRSLSFLPACQRYLLLVCLLSACTLSKFDFLLSFCLPLLIVFVAVCSMSFYTVFLLNICLSS